MHPNERKPTDVSEGENEAAVQAIAGDVQRYLALHPDAADSIEGIHRWWLSRELSRESAETVERALEMLIADGLLMRRRLPDGHAVYAADARHPGFPD